MTARMAASRAGSAPSIPPVAPPVRQRARPAPVYHGHEDAVIAAALAILESRLRVAGSLIDSPQTAEQFLRLHLAERRREVFAVLFLDAQHRSIAFEVLFQGALTETTVYPGEVVRRALELGAAATVLAHNHPSGESTPSAEDERLTARLKSALALVDIKVIDHIIVAGGSATSFAQRGLL